MFVTVYDKLLHPRECLGEWFYDKPWNIKKENALIKKVLDLGKTTSRLTGGRFVNIPLSNYTVTYLYEDTNKNFIRGWHGIKYNAFYLPDVLLEHTFNNGKWITKEDKLWPQENRFYIKDTLEMLVRKANISKNKQYILYFTNEYHKQI